MATTKVTTDLIADATITTAKLASTTGSGAVVLATSPTLTTPTISTLTSAAATALTLQSAGTTAVTVDTSQRVGIGTASPGEKLEVNGIAGDGEIISVTNAGSRRVSAAIGGNGRGYFYLRDNTPTTQVMLDTGGVSYFNGGNVGIGTSSPSKKLEVYATADSLQIESIVRNDQAGTGVAAIGFNVSSSGGSETTSTKAGIGLQRGFVFGGGALCFYNNNSGASGDFTTADERLRIDSSGNVGIGTASPTAKLHVAGGADSTIRNTASAGSSWFVGSNVGSYILHNESNTPMLFTTNGTERMRIDSSGGLMVNTTSMTAAEQMGLWYSSNNGPGLTIRDTAAQNGNTFIRFSNGATAAGSITTNGTTSTSYGTSSDYRMKENIQLMSNTLEKVLQLKPCTYNWKQEFGGSSGQGFIAHELQAIVPDCVTGEKDAVDADGKPIHQGIDTSFLVATLTAAIQELKAIIDTQAAQITALNAKVGI